MKQAAGFSLLEVLVALFIASLLALASHGVIRQAVMSREQADAAQWALLCARELSARWRIESAWPTPGISDGQLQMAARTCHWRLDTQDTGVPGLRRGALWLSDSADQARPLGRYDLFLVRP